MLTVHIYSHGLYLTNFSNMGEVNVIMTLAAKYKTLVRYFERGKVKYKVGHYYTVTNLKYTNVIKNYFFTFLKSRLEEIISVLEHEGISYQKIYHDSYDGERDGSLEFEVVGKSLWEDQKPYVSYILEDGIRKLIPLQTGSGKGTILSFALSRLKGRSFFQIKKSYLVKLKKELIEDTTLKDRDILIIKSTYELYKLIDSSKKGIILPTVLMCPMGMLDNFVQDWKTTNFKQGFDSPYNPINLFKNLKVTTRVIDETHEWFDKIYFIDTLTNVNKAIYLSGTFNADAKHDTLRNTLQAQLIALDERPPIPKPKAFGTFIRQPYTLPHMENIINKAETSPHGYSQIKYEQGILARNHLKDMFFGMLGDLYDEFFINWVKDDDKGVARCLFLFCLTETCTQFTQYLKQRFPDRDIRRYIGEDPSSILDEADNIISTVKSCGTAIDIKGLTLCINTFMTKKKELILQMRGRLRDPSVRGLVTEGIYLMTYNPDSKWQNEAMQTNSHYLRPLMNTFKDNLAIKHSFDDHKMKKKK